MFALVHAPIDGLELEEPVEEGEVVEVDTQEAETQAEIDAQEAATQAEVDAQILDEAQAAVDAAESVDADGSASETVHDSQGDAASPTVDGEDTPVPDMGSDNGVPSTPDA